MAASPEVSAERLWSRHIEMSRFGRREDGGANRPALGPGDIEARSALARWAIRRGFDVAMDRIGNFHVTRAGSEPGLAPVQTGSHLDTQPAGGHFDGIYGVLAGFEVLEAIDDLGLITRRPIRVTSWTNEEGVRFSPPLMGSGVFAGAIELDHALGCSDGDGVSVGAAIAAMRDLLPQQVREVADVGLPEAYVEAHIEQGPVLEQGGLEIGIVTDVVGIRQYRLRVSGIAGHAGTVPMSSRSDALAAAVDLGAGLFRAASDHGGDLRFTIGRFEVSPGGPSTIPDKVEMVIDLRSSEEPRLDRFEAEIRAACRRIAPPAGAELDVLTVRAPVGFDPDLVGRIQAAASRLGKAHRRLSSGAGHDAMLLAGLCPAAMLFIPCRDGISHNINERATPEHMAAGAEVLADVLVDLACA